MNIVIRADASNHIGSGHIMRCLVLAEQLKKEGHDVSFACRPQQGDLNDFIAKKNFPIITMRDIFPEVLPKSDSDYLGWLQCSVQEDVDDFLAKVESADLVITDHYAIDKEWQKKVRARLGCYIFAIDDLVREHDADIILDQTLGRQTDEYQNANCALTGCNFALLSPKFSQMRKFAYERIKPTNKARVLISMGAIDKPNVTLAALKQLSGLSNVAITVLLSPRAPGYNSVASYCHGFSNIQHIDFSDDMAELMLRHDISIGAPGTTSWERACLGLPSVVIPIAENQVEICKQLTKEGAAVEVRLDEVDTSLLSKLKYVLQEWERFYYCNMKICDGQGVVRVVSKIVSLK